MSYPQKFSVTLETSSGGAVTGYIQAVRGQIAEIIYTKDDFADASTFTITTEDSGQGVWTESSVNASTKRTPRQATHSVLGVAATYDDVGGNAINAPIFVANERIKIVITAGGSVKAGTFTVIIV